MGHPDDHVCVQSCRLHHVSNHRTVHVQAGASRHSSAVPTYLSETGVEIGDRGPANAFNAILLISGVPIAYWVDYGCTKSNEQCMTKRLDSSNRNHKVLTMLLQGHGEYR